jgi:hypothetical protein
MPKNCNPLINEFLTIYSQSERSTRGTRGYDVKTYVETKLDRQLIPTIFDPKTKLVILSGNAGDGKTAFIQSIEERLLKEQIQFSKKTDNGCVFSINGISYQTLYDGSQDFEGTKNDTVLASFFHEFEGDKLPTSQFTKVIAINEGKLRDFILNKPQYRWLGRQIHHYLDYQHFKPHESLVFINLNLRSVVDKDNGTDSIFDLLLDKFLDKDKSAGFWEDCTPQNCDYSERCYIKFNIDNLLDQKKGAEIRRRLKRLLLAVYFRKQRHITMRDLRSILSLILFNKYTCEQLQSHLLRGESVINRFYYNSVFNSIESDRIAQLLAELDIAAVCNPKLDNFIHFHSPDSPEIQSLYIKGANDYKADLPHLMSLYKNRPQGTQDDDPQRHENAHLYHASIRRKFFFESVDEKMLSGGFPTWKELLPYRQFDRFLEVILKKSDPSNTLRNELTLAISKSERIYNETVGQENLCLRSAGAKRSPTKSFYGFPASEFEVIVKDIGSQGAYLEHLPNCIYYRDVDKTAELEIPLDLFEILCRIHDGYAPTAAEIRTFFLNLEMFKRRVTAKRSDRIFLTEDDSNLFEIKKDPFLRLVMSKMGG